MSSLECPICKSKEVYSVFQFFGNEHPDSVYVDAIYCDRCRAVWHDPFWQRYTLDELKSFAVGTVMEHQQAGVFVIRKTDRRKKLFSASPTMAFFREGSVIESLFVSTNADIPKFWDHPLKMLYKRREKHDHNLFKVQ